MARAALVAAVVLLLHLFSPVQAAVPELRQPAWAELSPQQKQILAPLAQDWDRLEVFRKKKWLGIAKRYPNMKPEEQARVQRRMTDWARLTPDQRKKARERYLNLQKVPPERREVVKQKWQEYKELPEEEKKRLAEKAPARRPGSPKAGSAKPVPVPVQPGKAAAPVPTQPAAPTPPLAPMLPPASPQPAPALVPAPPASP